METSPGACGGMPVAQQKCCHTEPRAGKMRLTSSPCPTAETAHRCETEVMAAQSPPQLPQLPHSHPGSVDMEVPGMKSSGAGNTQSFHACSLTLQGKKRYREDPKRFCSRIDSGQSHHLLMPYKTSPATLSQHRMPRCFDFPENTQTFLRFKMPVSSNQQCICGASSQSLLFFFTQEMLGWNSALPRKFLMIQASSESSCPSQNHTRASVALMSGAGKATTQPSQNSLSPSTEYGIHHDHGTGETLAKDTLIHCPSQFVSHPTPGASLQLHTRVENQ